MPERIQISAVTHRTTMRLKSWSQEHATGANPVVVAGRNFPSNVGGRLDGLIRVLCIGPGEWLATSDQHHATAVRDAFKGDLEKYSFALVDLTDALAGFSLSGDAARDVLSKGCGLDFHPPEFPTESCARTRLAGIPVVVECHDASHFELFVARSYSHYLKAWLTDAAIAFQRA